MKFLGHWLALALLASSAAAQPASTKGWQVCVADVSTPPYLSDKSDPPGIFERLLLDAGRQAGLRLSLLRLPNKRCTQMLASGQVDAAIAAPSRGAMAIAQFPMRNGSVDPERRLGQLQLVWVKRAESPITWDGHHLAAIPDLLLVGTRRSLQAALEPLHDLGLRVDDSALNTPQLLRMLALKRIDLAVTLEGEANFALQDQNAQLKSLAVLQKPLSRVDYYVALKPHSTPDEQAAAEALWAAISVLRDLPQYQPR